MFHNPGGEGGGGGWRGRGDQTAPPDDWLAAILLEDVEQNDVIKAQMFPG